MRKNIKVELHINFKLLLFSNVINRMNKQTTYQENIFAITYIQMIYTQNILKNFRTKQ